MIPAENSFHFLLKLSNNNFSHRNNNLPVKKLKYLIWSALNTLKIGGPIQLLLNGSLIENGWYKSFYDKQSIDINNQPIPWCTYPFIKFIEPRLKKDFVAFEFGCGNSTLWYSKKIKSIKSVEHNKEWYNKMCKQIPSNSIIVYKDLNEDGEYAKEALNSNAVYHIVIIDGEDRNNCLRHSLLKLTHDGIIIFDNTDREDYLPSYQLLETSGFKRIDFTGMAPIINFNSCTSIFYRANNCLGI